MQAEVGFYNKGFGLLSSPSPSPRPKKIPQVEQSPHNKKKKWDLTLGLTPTHNF